MNNLTDDKLQQITISTSKKKRVYWTPTKDKLLLDLIESNGFKLNKQILSDNFNMSYKQCYDRYLNIKPLINKGAWTEEEEQKIKELIEKHGERWSRISREFGGSRSGKQIRFHCKNRKTKTNPKILFTQEEDQKLYELYKDHGPKWDYISSFFERTPQYLKNRYFNHRTQQNKGKTSISNESESLNNDNKTVNINIIRHFSPRIIIRYGEIFLPEETIDGDKLNSFISDK